METCLEAEVHASGCHAADDARTRWALLVVLVGGHYSRRCERSADLRDGFHQFLRPQLVAWFVFILEGAKAGSLGITQVVNDSGGMVAMDLWEHVWPASGGMAMGWSRALWICHETLTAVMKRATNSGGDGLLEKRETP